MTHGGGTANVTLNQKQNGGSWVALGSWSFAPGSGHKVTLAAAAEGTTIADAMLFVAAGAQPANLLYVHADHLGSPQKLTDAIQATVWNGVFDPFGEEVAVAGLAAMPLRFPGQYADEETGYSYNYFRDYDPTLGRYVQSDPMALEAGVNTYAYAEANPVAFIDPLGLQVTVPIPWELPIIRPSPLPAPIDPILPIPIPEAQGDTIGRGRYDCTVKCDLHPTSTPPVAGNDEPAQFCYGGCPDWVVGHGLGSSPDEAWNNAWDSANAATPLGCYKRHCRGVAGSCKNRKGGKAKL